MLPLASALLRTITLFLCDSYLLVRGRILSSSLVLGSKHPHNLKNKFDNWKAAEKQWSETCPHMDSTAKGKRISTQSTVMKWNINQSASLQPWGFSPWAPSPWGSSPWNHSPWGPSEPLVNFWPNIRSTWWKRAQSWTQIDTEGLGIRKAAENWTVKNSEKSRRKQPPSLIRFSVFHLSNTRMLEMKRWSKHQPSAAVGTFVSFAAC